MKVMVCADLLAGDAGGTNMPVEVFSRWQADKAAALSRAVESARAAGAEQCLVAGGLFVEGFVAQSLVEACIGALGGAGMPVTYCPRHREAADLAWRVEVPANVSVVRSEPAGLSGCMRVRTDPQGASELVLSTKEGVVTKALLPLEPQGFGEASRSGYLLVDVQDGVVADVSEQQAALHPFVTRAIDMTGLESSKQALPALKNIMLSVSLDACLRVVLRGSVKLGVYLDTGELARALSDKFFYAEVDDECTVGLDEESMAYEVSLMAEFARQVQGDDSLSPSEKSRIVRCGWNALNGKGLVE